MEVISCEKIENEIIYSNIACCILLSMGFANVCIMYKKY